MDTRPANKWGPLDTANAVAFLSYSSTSTVTPICLVVLARELQFSLTQAGLLACFLLERKLLSPGKPARPRPSLTRIFA